MPNSSLWQIESLIERACNNKASLNCLPIMLKEILINQKNAGTVVNEMKDHAPSEFTDEMKIAIDWVNKLDVKLEELDYIISHSIYRYLKRSEMSNANEVSNANISKYGKLLDERYKSLCGGYKQSKLLKEYFNNYANDPVGHDIKSLKYQYTAFGVLVLIPLLLYLYNRYQNNTNEEELYSNLKANLLTVLNFIMLFKIVNFCVVQTFKTLGSTGFFKASEKRNSYIHPRDNDTDDDNEPDNEALQQHQKQL